MTRIYIGTCSWSDHLNFYPTGLPSNQQIVYYSRQFPVVELDASYYRLMPTRNYSLWAERTPEDFQFHVKAFRQLTFHDRKTPPTAEVAAKFSASLQPLRDAGKLAALAFQFPPWFMYRQSNLDYIRSLPDTFPGDQIAVEFRQRSWYDGASYPIALSALREAGIALTVVDEPQLGSGSVPTALDVTNPDLSIVRFHGRNTATWYKRVKTTAERFNYLYSEQELREWVPQIGTLAENAGAIYLLFNNNAEDYAIQNARQLRMILSEGLPGAEIVAPAAD